MIVPVYTLHRSVISNLINIAYSQGKTTNKVVHIPNGVRYNSPAWSFSQTTKRHDERQGVKMDIRKGMTKSNKYCYKSDNRCIRRVNTTEHLHFLAAVLQSA